MTSLTANYPSYTTGQESQHNGIQLQLITAFAEETYASVITAFEPLDELTTTQYWGVGTDRSELILPDMLTATSGAAITVTTTEDIAVSEWQSESTYDPETKGTYVFTPMLDLPEGYSVAGGVEPMSFP